MLTGADGTAEPRTPIARRTLISMRRGTYAWTLPLPDASGAGWTLETTPETFEALRLSLGEGRAGVAGRSLIAEGGPDEAPSLTFRPHHALTTKAGQPFALGLGHAVYAMAFHPAGDEAVLMARYHEPRWLHVGGLAVEAPTRHPSSYRRAAGWCRQSAARLRLCAYWPRWRAR